MASADYWKKRLLRHLLLMLCAAMMVMAIYALTPPPDVRHRASMALAYAALVYLLISLWLGPWNLLRGKPNPVSFDLRRTSESGPRSWRYSIQVLDLRCTCGDGCGCIF